jgi:hypothetical protein
MKILITTGLEFPANPYTIGIELVLSGRMKAAISVNYIEIL